MDGYLVRSVGEHVYGFAWRPQALVLPVIGGLLTLAVGGASLRASLRRVATPNGLALGFWALFLPIAVLAAVPERYAPLSEIFGSPVSRPVGLYRDLLAPLLGLSMLGLPLSAAALLALQQERQSEARTRWHQPLRALLIAGLCVGTALCSGRYAERITRLGTLPRAAAEYAHPVHVGVAFSPHTPLYYGVTDSRTRDDEPTPISMAAYSGWKVSSPAFTAPQAGRHRARARYECPPLSFWVEREVSFVAEEERGDPLFSPRLGDIVVYRKSAAPQRQVALAMEGRAALPPTKRWEGARLEITAERVEDGLRYLQLKVTQHISREYLLLLRGGETLLVSSQLEKEGTAVRHEGPALLQARPEHVPCRLAFLDEHGACACAPASPRRPAGLQYCEGVDLPPSKSRAGDGLGLAVASLLTGGVAAIAVGMTERDSGYRSGLVLESYTPAGGQGRYAPPLPPEARPLGDSPSNSRYKQEVHTILLRSLTTLRGCLTPTGRRTLALFLVVGADGALLHAAPAATLAPGTDLAPEGCAAARLRGLTLPRPNRGPVAFDLALSL